jgi:epsilon-lactone hydrolase
MNAISTGPARPVFEANGDVRVPAFTLPSSTLMSAQAQEMQRMRAQMPAMPARQEPDIAISRRQVDAMLAPRVAATRNLYPADVVEQKMGGVSVRVVTPAVGDHDPDRVLVNLHGGAFSVGWDSCSLIESLPIAALGRYRIVSVDYRMAPEFAHPAGVEDVAAVYRALLDHYQPGRIGIYGGSAGGALTAQAAAWLSAHGLPQAGAVGIFGAGAVRFGAGESAYVAGYIDGSFPPPSADGGPPIDITRGYFAGADMADAIVSPALHLDTLAKFPSTMIITGTRAMDMSPAIYTNSRLIKAGVKSTLIVGEGMGHCYYYQPDLPESQDAYDAIVGFFREHLK